MAHQGQANPLSLESSDYDRLWSTKYLHARSRFAGLGGFFETMGSSLVRRSKRSGREFRAYGRESRIGP